MLYVVLCWPKVVRHAKLQPSATNLSSIFSVQHHAVWHFFEKNDLTAETSLSVGFILPQAKNAWWSLKVETFSRPEKVWFPFYLSPLTSSEFSDFPNLTTSVTLAWRSRSPTLRLWPWLIKVYKCLKFHGLSMVDSLKIGGVMWIWPDDPFMDPHWITWRDHPIEIKLLSALRPPHRYVP